MVRIERASSGRALCGNCNELIDKDTLRIRGDQRWRVVLYHLHCYKPRGKDQFIKLSNVPSEYKEEVDTLVKRWNAEIQKRIDDSKAKEEKQANREKDLKRKRKAEEAELLEKKRIKQLELDKKRDLSWSLPWEEWNHVWEKVVTYISAGGLLRLGQTCAKLRLLSLRDDLWINLCTKIWKIPRDQLSDEKESFMQTYKSKTIKVCFNCKRSPQSVAHRLAGIRLCYSCIKCPQYRLVVCSKAAKDFEIPLPAVKELPHINLGKRLIRHCLITDVAELALKHNSATTLNSKYKIIRDGNTLDKDTGKPFPC